MKNILAPLAIVAMLLAGGSTEAASVTTNAVLTGTGVSNFVPAPIPPLPNAVGTLKVRVDGDFSGPGNATVFVSLDNLFSVNVRESLHLVTSNPDYMEAIFTVSKPTLAAILANSMVKFTFNSATPTVRSPFTVDATLSYASVPEPTSMAILGLGAVGLLAARRRRS